MLRPLTGSGRKESHVYDQARTSLREYVISQIRGVRGLTPLTHVAHPLPSVAAHSRTSGPPRPVIIRRRFIPPAWSNRHASAPFAHRLQTHIPTQTITPPILHYVPTHLFLRPPCRRPSFASSTTTPRQSPPLPPLHRHNQRKPSPFLVTTSLPRTSLPPITLGSRCRDPTHRQSTIHSLFQPLRRHLAPSFYIRSARSFVPNAYNNAPVPQSSLTDGSACILNLPRDPYINAVTHPTSVALARTIAFSFALPVHMHNQQGTQPPVQYPYPLPFALPTLRFRSLTNKPHYFYTPIVRPCHFRLCHTCDKQSIQTHAPQHSQVTTRLHRIPHSSLLARLT